MALLIPDEGECVALDRILAQDMYLRLYNTNITPSESDTVATYSETTFDGYAAKTLSGGSWPAASTTAGITSSTYAVQNFACTGTDADVYGQYYEDVATGVLLAAELASGAPFNVSNGQDIDVTPIFELD